MLEWTIGGDNYLLWMIPGVVLTLFANLRLRRMFGKYKRDRNLSGITGRETARTILDSEQLQKVPIKQIRGSLTDHYDPRQEVVNLSQPIYGKSTIAAMGVAAHEVGHAIQDKDGYFFMKLRGWIVPFANIGTNFGYLLIATGLVLDMIELARIGVLLFALTTLFALVTLPVEFDASKRAKQKLRELGLTKREEDAAVDDVLDAAAFTYIAAFATSAIQLVYWAKTVRDERKALDEKAQAKERRTAEVGSGGGGLFSSQAPAEATASGTGEQEGGVKIRRSDDPEDRVPQMPSVSRPAGGPFSTRDGG